MRTIPPKRKILLQVYHPDRITSRIIRLRSESWHCEPPSAMVRLHRHSCRAVRAVSRRSLLESNDNQPGGQSSRTITIHLTRDTLLLIAALAFLAVAILLD